MASDFVTTVLETLADGDPSPLQVIWQLALAVNDAYSGVQGNTEQCKILNDQVQHVATSLKGVPYRDLAKPEIAGVIASLRETLRAAASLIEGFKKKKWYKKMLQHASINAKFDGLFEELNRALQVCGFTFSVSAGQFYILKKELAQGCF